MSRSYATILLSLGLTIAASSAMLYRTSDRVTALDKELRKINAQIAEEERSLHVLRAEWVYLSNPARIEAEARKHLRLQPTEAHHIASRENIQMAWAKPGEEQVSTRLADATTPAMRAARSGSPRPRTERDRILTLLNAGRINDHVALQHSASAKKAAPDTATVARTLAGGKTDKIGALIGTLGLRP